MLTSILPILTTPIAQTILVIFPKGDKPDGFLFFTLTLLAIFLALAVHESGHLVAGILQGFRFELFVVGLLGIKREKNAIKIFLNKNIGYMGGVVVTIPVTQDVLNRRKFAIMVASGPIASFILAIVAFWVFSYSTSGAIRGFWFVTGSASVAVLLATTLPTKSGIFFTDRAKFQRLLNKGKVGETEEALLTIMSEYIKDNSCKDISVDKARLLQDDSDKAIKFWGYYYEYCYFKENLMVSESEGALKNLLFLKPTIPGQLWKALKIDTDVNC